MSSKNRVDLMGNLVADPVVRCTAAGTPVCNARLALNRKHKDAQGTLKETVTYVDVTIWGARGDSFAKYHQKGDLVSIDGRLEMEEWTDKEGQKRSKLMVVAEEWWFVGERKSARAAPDGAENPF